MNDVRLTVKVESVSEVVREYTPNEMLHARVTADAGDGTTVDLPMVHTAMLRVTSEASEGKVVSVEHSRSTGSAFVHLQPGEVYVTEDIGAGSNVVLKSNTGTPLVDVLALGS